MSQSDIVITIIKLGYFEKQFAFINFRTEVRGNHSIKSGRMRQEASDIESMVGFIDIDVNVSLLFLMRNMQ